MLNKNDFKEMKQKFKDIDWKELGKNIIRGLVEGIKSLAHLVGDAIVDVGNAAVDIWDGFWGNDSPSKLMIERGKNIMQGVGVGAEREKSSLIRSFEEMARGISEAMSQATIAQPIPVGAAGGSQVNHNTEINPSFDFSGTTLDENGMMDVFELLRLLYGGAQNYG